MESNEDYSNYLSLSILDNANFSLSISFNIIKNSNNINEYYIYFEIEETN